MRKIIKLTENDLARIVRRVIKENEEEWIDQSQDMDDESDFSKMNLDDDEEFGQTDKGEEELQDLIEEARDILENECGYDIEEINSMDERDIVECLFEEGHEDLAGEIESLLEQEGF